MAFNKLRLFLSILAFMAIINPAHAVVSSTLSESFDSTTEGTSSTSKSTKKMFSQNDQERLKIFVDQNFDRLQEEAARGSGVLLSDYVSLLGCQNSQAVMYKALQKNYQTLFNNGKGELVHRTENLINSKPELAMACGSQS